ncbi:TadE/TadG family type IV pilus assembly protein [Brooklawnia cerclae]|nr:TadE/TadG family type IV pilus assembly protein [Brooklawnia cerclae]
MRCPRARGASGRGLSESVQWAVVMPVVLLALFGLVQGGVWLAGRSAVQQAAMAAAEHAAFAGGNAAQARSVAESVAGGSGLQVETVVVQETGTGVRVDVSARVPVVLPGRWSAVEASAFRAKEG